MRLPAGDPALALGVERLLLAAAVRGNTLRLSAEELLVLRQLKRRLFNT